MNDKYYTPEIEEFHVGFEYEYKHKARSGWNKQKQSRTDWLTDFEKGDYRVKHLDREDIESLGWEADSQREWHKIFYKNDIWLEYKPEKKWCYIYQEDESFNMMGEKNATTLFRGNIKNKSELKRVMKMIGI